MFQLSVNVTAVLFIVISLIMGLDNPFNTLQLLWINVIMDGPPALTLGLELNSQSVMTQKPVKRSENIINVKMFLRILIHAILTCFILIAQYKTNFLKVSKNEVSTVIFTLFILFNLFNAFNCRETGSESIFKNLKNNNEENETENEKLVETFLSKGEFQQKLILTFMNFLDDFKLETHYINIIPYLSVQYMKYKVGFVRDKILKDISIKQNAIFIHYINDELKHVNYKMFIHLNYDNSPEMFCSFTQEEKELISIIQSYLQLNEFYEMPEIMSMKECIDNLETDEEKVMKQLQEHYELVYEFINKLNNCGESPPSQNEFNIFKPDEQQLINAYIQTKNPNAINAYTIKEDNCNYFIYKQIIIAEFNPSIHEDIKRYYRKLLLFNSKALPNSLSNFISLVLDFPFDPNNTYMYQNFASFKNEEQLMIIQEILCRQCLLAYHTLYYDNLSHDVLVNKIASTTELALANNENKTYINYFEKEMNYLLCYFKESLGVFINKLLYVDNQTVFKFTNEFSDKERDIIVKMLIYKSSLTKDEKYTLMKNELDNYLIDLSHNERIQDIINKLDLVLTQQLDHSLFIALCEYIKETFYEIDYIIEKISADCTEIDNFIMKIYLSFDKDKRIIIDKLIQCINETKYNKNLLPYKEEFD